MDAYETAALFIQESPLADVLTDVEFADLVDQIVDDYARDVI